jgi:uncharacterized repeat protein (TIGR01451 family)
VSSGDAIEYTLTLSNGSPYALNGAQAVVTLPEGVAFDSVSRGSATVQGQDVVVSLGRVASRATVTLQIHGHVLGAVRKHLEAHALVRSATALPVDGGKARTKIDDQD